MKNYAMILAAGNSSRMKTDIPKCIYPVLGSPLISYILGALNISEIHEKILVVGTHEDEIKKTIGDHFVYVKQEKPLGTGNAALCGSEAVTDMEGNTIIINGDLPLINATILANLLEFHIDRKNDVTVISTIVNDPTDYGRIIRNHLNTLDHIIEERDCNRDEKNITEVNAGIYCVKNLYLKELLAQIQIAKHDKEYYITDIIKLSKEKNLKVDAYIFKDSTKFLAVRDLLSLSIISGIMQQEINKKHLLNGVNLINQETITLANDVVIESGAVIHPNTYITGNSVIRKNAQVGPNSEIHNSIIGENCVVKHSLIYDSIVGKNTTIGPFAHLRNHTEVAENLRIGNFVEIKNSKIGNKTKISHLTYVGDTTCGENVNFGCGTVTVNYDGKNKYRTEIGGDVFIGCNSNLIAPIKIEDNVFIAAGSTIVSNVPKGSFTIAREKQTIKPDYAEKYGYASKKK